MFFLSLARWKTRINFEKIQAQINKDNSQLKRTVLFYTIVPFICSRPTSQKKTFFRILLHWWCVPIRNAWCSGSVLYRIHNSTLTCFQLFSFMWFDAAQLSVSVHFSIWFYREMEICAVFGIVKKATIRKRNKATANWIFNKLLSKLIITVITTSQRTLRPIILHTAKNMERKFVPFEMAIIRFLRLTWYSIFEEQNISIVLVWEPEFTPIRTSVGYRHWICQYR